MFAANILEEFRNNQDNEYVKLSTNRKTFIVHLYLDDNNEPQAQFVHLKEAKSKEPNEEKRLKILKQNVAKNPNRIFIEPDNKTLGMLCYSKGPLQLPKTIDKFQWMTAKECFNWLLLKSIGL